jgi:tetratricopeptide (TPR) repeat protein
LDRSWAAWFGRALALGVLTAAPAAYGQPSPPQASAHDRALELFSDGKKAYKQGDFRTAIDHLEAAYELEPAPVLLYNLARAYEGIGELDKAVSDYERFLTADPNAEDRGAIEARVATLKRQIEIQSEKQAPAEAPPPEAPVVPARSPSSVPVVVLAAGGAGLVIGGIFGGLAMSENHTQNAATTSQLDGQNAHDRAGSFAVASEVGFIAGGVLAAVGVVWLILDRTGTKAHAQSGALAPLVIHF